MYIYIYLYMQIYIYLYMHIYIYVLMHYYIFSITRVCFLGVCWGRFVVLEGLEAQKRAKC